VLRLDKGDHITLLDNSGWQYDVEIGDIERDQLYGKVHAKTLATGEPRTKLTIYQGLLRGPQFELVLQKATEIGVSAIVPTIAQRCRISNIGDASEGKIARWTRIIAEAAEQSGRGKLPTLRPATMLPQALEQVRGGTILLWEDEDSLTLREALRGEEYEASDGNGWRPFSLNIFVGPEGGFTSEEIDLARTYGITTVTLGPRRLRSETAALVATALVLNELGDMVRS
jgi:16S rRNA (uracil1498-N3)-methyltransferase